MTPDWIKKEAEKWLGKYVNDELIIDDAVEAAMLSVAARVEEETIRRCRQAKIPLRAEGANPAAINYNATLAEYSQHLAALPRKYQEPKP